MNLQDTAIFLHGTKMQCICIAYNAMDMHGTAMQCVCMTLQLMQCIFMALQCSCLALHYGNAAGGAKST
jgi:hypothetical protein